MTSRRIHDLAKVKVIGVKFESFEQCDVMRFRGLWPEFSHAIHKNRRQGPYIAQSGLQLDNVEGHRGQRSRSLVFKGKYDRKYRIAQLIIVLNRSVCGVHLILL